MPRFKTVAQDLNPNCLEYNVLASLLLRCEIIIMKTECVNTLNFLGTNVFI